MHIPNGMKDIYKKKGPMSKTTAVTNKLFIEQLNNKYMTNLLDSKFIY